MLSVLKLTPEDHELISELYFLHNRDRAAIGRAFGLDEAMPISFLTCPPVLKLIRRKANEMESILTREEHIRNLQSIRDEAVSAARPDFKAAVAAEVAAGNAAGIYDRVPEIDAGNSTPANQLTSEEIRKKLNRLPSPTIDMEETASFEEVEDEGGF